MNKNYVEELRSSENPLEKELAEYLNYRLIKTNLTIFEYVPIDGIKEGYQHLIPLIDKLRKKGFFDGD